MKDKTTDKKIDDLALAMAAGFKAVEKKFDGLARSVQENTESINDLALAVADGFAEVDQKIAQLPTKEYVDQKIAQLPDKAYIGDKLADLKGDLIVKLRREDEKVNALTDILKDRLVLTKNDVGHLRKKFQIFPTHT